MRLLWLAAGLMFVALGIIGALLPVMPTTIFLILAAGCFARSSPALEARLLNHPRYGPTLRAWRAEGAIGRKGKIAACKGMAIGFLVFLLSVHPQPLLAGIVALAMGGSAAYVLSRPAPASELAGRRPPA